MYIRTFILIFVVAASFESCTGQSAEVKNLSPDEFAKAIAGKEVQLIDVRTPEEYKDKHLIRSTNINFNSSTFANEFNQLDKSKPVYIYCLAGGRSAEAANFAVKNGFREVYNLEGGIMAWTGARKPIETANAKPIQKKGMSFDDYLNHLKSRDKLVLVDFNAVWCGPCKILKPIVNRSIKKYSDKAELLDVDVDQNPDIASTMHITGIPLLVLYKQGKEVWRTMGLTDEETINNKLKEFSN